MLMLAILILFYLTSHLFQLTLLPIFADESIYIRWTQLMIDDFSRYFLFPLNDGKTPLFMWLMLPFQYVFTDQLYAGRFVAVLVGLAQVLTNGYLILKLGGRKKTAWLAMLLTTVLPFWYFHHRMALIDGLLTLWLSTSIIGLLGLVQNPPTRLKQVINKNAVIYLLVFGLSFGIAILTKMTAILFIPVFALFALYPPNLSLQRRSFLALLIGVGMGLGLGIFSLLALFPGFGQLFTRGSDFLYPANEVFLQGKWQETIRNFPSYLLYFINYVTLPVLLLHLGSLFLPKHRRTFHLLFWSALLFNLPIMLLGRVVYPRYLLPAALFITLSVSLAVQEIVDTWISGNKVLWKKTFLAIAFVLFITNTFSNSLYFMFTASFTPDQIPFVSADRAQYLTEWSSGHGIKETVTFIQDQASTQPTAVATEGYFGTLPDAINVYLHRQNVENLYVEGIGQPVGGIPDVFRERAAAYPKVLLVVNAHRLQMKLAPENLLKEYCRPYSAPCLQIWDITSLIHSN